MKTDTKSLDLRYGKLEIPSKADRVRVILRELGRLLHSPAVLMDVGCAAGSITKHFRSLPFVAEIIGVDGSIGALESARRYCNTVIHSDLNRAILFQSNRVDIVVSMYVMEHLTHNEQYLREMYRVLKPGGYLVLQVVNLAAWCNRIGLLLGWQPWFTETGMESVHGNPIRKSVEIAGHVRYHVPAAFKAIIEAQGFIVERRVGFSELEGMKGLDRLIARLLPSWASGLVYVARKPIFEIPPRMPNMRAYQSPKTPNYDNS